MKFTIALLAGISNALITRQQTYQYGKTEAQHVQEIKSRNVEENPQEMWFNATIDHFDNHGAGGATYPMRYLVDDTYFNKEKGPIIFYAGNEGDVWTFWDASGFMHTTLAEEFGALVVFGEHRYYGESMPFGDQTFDRKNLDKLTVEQAMFDYVELIKSIKQTEGLEDRAVIVGGGSYGGMLSAWLRMKYPQWFQGALAASAPILFFDGYVDPYAYDDIATGVYAKADANCPVSIKNGWDKLFEIKNDPSYYA
jgi:pimeloyl-ACP methyl ester carboxylesterase